MKVSEITLDKEISIEIPNCDAIQVIYNQYGLQQYVAAFGDVEIELKSENDCRREYHVPVFAESRKKFEAAKLESCKRWGCE